MSGRRALHFVFKVGDRQQTIRFFKDILGMKVLRHEEFEDGCKATCNGPYDGKWSKTMVGYGPEDSHFVVELTYNYGISNYKLGNDFLGITIQSSQALKNARDHDWPIHGGDSSPYVEAPGGYRFYLLDQPQPVDSDPLLKVVLASSDLKKSLNYWVGLLGLQVYDQSSFTAVLGFEKNQTKIEFKDIGEEVNHCNAFGRIAFTCPTAQLSQIELIMKEASGTILTPLVSLDTPGKATVVVVILADPDGHEICFVGDEGFSELSRVDQEADRLLAEAMEGDKSDAWFAKKGRTKVEA